MKNTIATMRFAFAGVRFPEGAQPKHSQGRTVVALGLVSSGAEQLRLWIKNAFCKRAYLPIGSTRR